MQTPIGYFTELTDLRVDRSKDHLMENIIFITIAAVICGAETGIPFHDTFNRFFSALDPNERFA
jgi:hypothetical protein